MTEYFDQESTTLYKKTGVNGYNKAAYDAGSVIGGRIKWAFKLVRDKNGNQVISNCNIMTGSKPEIDDQIMVNGLRLTVIAIEDHKDITGVFLYRTAYM